MNLKIVSLLLLCTAAAVSCITVEEEDTTKKPGYYFAMTHAAFLNVRSTQQRFIDKTGEAVQKIQSDSSAIIDTAELRSLLDVAGKACTDRQKMIQALAEADTANQFKGKVEAYIKLFTDAKENEFNIFITTVNTISNNRYATVDSLLRSKLLELKAAEAECTKASEAFQKKHEIKLNVEMKQ